MNNIDNQKEDEIKVRDISLAISGGLLVASFTMLNESVNFAMNENTANIVYWGYNTIAFITPFLAFDIIYLYFNAPDGIVTKQEKTNLALRIIAWFITITGIALIIGGKNNSMLISTLIGLTIGYLYHNRNKRLQKKR